MHFVRGGVGHRYVHSMPCLSLAKIGSDVVLFDFQWPALIGLFRRNLNHALNRGFIPNGKQDRARRGRRPHLLHA